jgi:hypothetical protein
VSGYQFKTEFFHNLGRLHQKENLNVKKNWVYLKGGKLVLVRIVVSNNLKEK